MLVVGILGRIKDWGHLRKERWKDGYGYPAELYPEIISKMGKCHFSVKSGCAAECVLWNIRTEVSGVYE